MEKTAARSYGRNPDGSRRTAKQLIMQLGGGINIPNPTNSDQYFDNRRENRFAKVPKHYLTGDKKYNYTRTSPERYEIGRHLQKSPKYSEKMVRQHKNYANRLPISQHDVRRHKFDIKKDIEDTFSGRHPVPRVFGETARQNVQDNKTILRDIDKAERKKFLSKYKTKQKQSALQKEIDSGKIPEALIGVGLLTAGMMSTKSLYEKIKKKSEKHKEDQAKRELVAKK